MTLYRATTEDGRAVIVDADRITRARTAATKAAGAPTSAPEPIALAAIVDAATLALDAIRGALGEGVSLTCAEYADVRALAAIIAPEELAELDERHASTDDDPEDCAHAAYLASA